VVFIHPTVKGNKKLFALGCRRSKGIFGVAHVKTEEALELIDEGVKNIRRGR